MKVIVDLFPIPLVSKNSIENMNNSNEILNNKCVFHNTLFIAYEYETELIVYRCFFDSATGSALYLNQLTWINYVC